MKKIIAGLICSLFLFFVFQTAVVYAADANQEPYQRSEFGLSDVIGPSGLPQEKSAQKLAGQIIGAVLSLVGVIFFVLIIYAGILWMIARGNEEQVKKAKNILTYAVLGLVVVLAAYAITSYIGNALIGN